MFLFNVTQSLFLGGGWGVRWLCFELLDFLGAVLFEIVGWSSFSLPFLNCWYGKHLHCFRAKAQVLLFSGVHKFRKITYCNSLQIIRGQPPCLSFQKDVWKFLEELFSFNKIWMHSLNNNMGLMSRFWRNVNASGICVMVSSQSVASNFISSLSCASAFVTLWHLFNCDSVVPRFGRKRVKTKVSFMMLFQESWDTRGKSTGPSNGDCSTTLAACRFGLLAYLKAPTNRTWTTHQNPLHQFQLGVGHFRTHLIQLVFSL